MESVINELANRGHQISLFTQFIDYTKIKLNSKIKIHEIGGHLPESPLFWLTFKKIGNKFVKKISQEKYDAIFGVNFPNNYITSLIPKDICLWKVFYIQEPYRWFYDKEFISNETKIRQIVLPFIGKIFRKYDIQAIQKQNVLIANSYYSGSLVKKTYGKNPNICYPLLNLKNLQRQEDTTFFLKMGFHKGPILLSLGLSHAMKGADFLMDSFILLKKEIPNCQLVIGGNIFKKNKKMIKSKMKNSVDLQRDTHIVGFIDDETLPKYFSNATVTVYPSIGEPFGLIPIQSQKCGTPVVAFPGGPSETIISGKTGEIARNRNVQDLAHKIQMIIQNPKIYSVKNCIENIDQNFDFSKNIDFIENKLKI